MMNYLFLSKTLLFNGLNPKEIEILLSNLKVNIKQYNKKDMIYKAGDKVNSLGLILSGSVLIQHYDFWGNTNILDNLSKGNIFAETYACLPNEPIMVNVIANEDSEILFININNILNPSPASDLYRQTLLNNLILLTAKKNLNLSQKIFHTSAKSIRNRVLSYLSHQTLINQKREFLIPFNRQQLSEYLNVDRSALSNEISKMEKDGLIKVNKNHFILLDDSQI